MNGDGEALRKIAADLREARRYVRSSPDEARRQVGQCIAAMDRETVGVYVLPRLAANLRVGMKFVGAMPDLLRSYLECAADELEILAGPIEVLEVQEPAA